MRAILQSNGESRGNPGSAGIGFTLVSGEEKLACGGWPIGLEEDGVAEYKALIWGLQNAAACGVDQLDARVDSPLLVKQVKGSVSVTDRFEKPLFGYAMQLIDVFDSFEIHHVFRDANVEACGLLEEAIDRDEGTGSYAVPFTEEETEGLDMLQQFEINKNDIDRSRSARDAADDPNDVRS